MLKFRVIPTLLYRNGGLVKGVGFDSWRSIGAVMQAVKVYNMRDVDELIFLDVAATREGHAPDFELVDDIADECFMPLTVGGGLRSVEHVEAMLRVGADKVAIGSAAHEVEGLIARVAQRFGSQCVVASVDVLRAADQWIVTTRSGTKKTQREPIEAVRRLADQGAGEILLTSVDRDGTMNGYDIELYQRACDAVDIPVIAAGGAGSCEDIVSVVTHANVSAASAASLFHFTEVTPRQVKHALGAAGIPVRR